MARILYAVAGEGYGHATRAHSVGMGLVSRGHDVRFLSSHMGRAYLCEHFPGHVYDIFGLRLVFRQGRLKTLRTITHNAGRACSSLGPSNSVIRRTLATFRPDLVITDFEPFAPFWARWLGIPYISLDNQHLLTHCAVDHPPGFVRDRITAFATIRFYYGGAKRYFITTFIRAPIRYHPATLVDPILRPLVYTKQPTERPFLLAYKGGEGRHDAMRVALESYDHMPIRAYGLGGAGLRGHVTYKPIHPETFLDDLASCAGVIGMAGHSLVCEAVYLGKPMLLSPLAGQYEQAVNAHYVEKLGYGRSTSRLDAAVIDGFVRGLDAHRSALAAAPRAKTIDPILDAIEREIP